MCGILAVYHPDRTISSEKFANALRSMSHRGPDDNGVRHLDAISLGHRRLSIQDLSPAGHQPMTDPSGQVTIIFNGQVYNHPDFRPELLEAGYRFRSTGDTETVLALYLKHGAGCFSLLRGMWAIVIWDARTQQMIISRDRLGIKPLYIRESSDGLELSSEIKGLVGLADKSPVANETVVRKYIARGWLDDVPETMFQGISSFPAATTRIYQGGRLQQEIAFWSRPLPSRELSNSEVLRDSLIGAVEKHLLSDAPVASTLSGGIDSTGLVCILANVLGRKSSIKTFTVIADDIPDESHWVEITKQWTGVEHEYINIAGVDYAQALDELIEYHDEPTFSVGQVNQYIFRKAVAKQGFKVLLVGDGADEVCAGYAKIVPMYVQSLIAAGRWQLATRALRDCLDLTGNTLAKQIQRQRLFHRDRIGARTVQEFRFGYTLFANQAAMADDQLFPTVTYRHLDANPASQFYTELLDRFRIDIPQVLRNEDRNGMAHSLEVRPVYLDHMFFETAWRYPFEMFMAGGRNKAVLRDALNGIVPDAVLSNKKKFVRPGSVRSLIYDTIREKVADAIQNAFTIQPGVWRDDLLELFVRDCVSGDENNALVWFRFYMLQRWYALKIHAPRPAYTC